MKTVLQKSFALAALSFLCAQPVFAMTLAEAEAACKKANGHLVVTRVVAGARYVCKVGEKVVSSGTATPQAAPAPSQAAPTPVVPRAGLTGGKRPELLWDKKATTPVTPAQPTTKPLTPKITTVVGTTPAQVRVDRANAALAQEMKNAGRDAPAVAAALKARGASAPETAQILKKVFNLTDAGANATVLKAAGFSGQQIGDALKKVFGLSAAMVGNHLKALGNSQTGQTDIDRKGTIVGLDLCTIVPLKVSGAIRIDNCAPPASAINVKITRKPYRCSTSLPSSITVNAVAAGGVYIYNIDQKQAAAGQYSIEAAFAERATCGARGTWHSNQSLPGFELSTGNFALSAAGATPAIHQFYYVAPTAVLRIPVTRMESYLQSVFGTITMRLNNHGPRSGNGFYMPQDSYVSYLSFENGMPVAKKKYFYIPEKRIDLDAGWYSPDFGDVLIYLNDINSIPAIVQHDGGGSFRLEYAFEDRGPEIKGYYINENTGANDSLVPDANITGFKVVARLSLTAVNGLIGYQVNRTLVEGNMEDTGICNNVEILGVSFDLCDPISKHWDEIRFDLGTKYRDGLNAGLPDFSRGFTALFDPSSPVTWVDSAHRFKGLVTRVSIVGSDVVIDYADTAR